MKPGVWTWDWGDEGRLLLKCIQLLPLLLGQSLVSSTLFHGWQNSSEGSDLGPRRWILREKRRYLCEQRSDPAVRGVSWCNVCHHVRITNCSKRRWSCGEASQISFDSSHPACTELVAFFLKLDIIRFQCRRYSQLSHCLPGRSCLQQSVISALKCLLRIDCRRGETSTCQKFLVRMSLCSGRCKLHSLNPCSGTTRWWL